MRVGIDVMSVRAFRWVNGAANRLRCIAAALPSVSMNRDENVVGKRARKPRSRPDPPLPMPRKRTRGDETTQTLTDSRAYTVPRTNSPPGRVRSAESGAFWLLKRTGFIPESRTTSLCSASHCLAERRGVGEETTAPCGCVEVARACLYHNTAAHGRNDRTVRLLRVHRIVRVDCRNRAPPSRVSADGDARWRVFATRPRVDGATTHPPVKKSRR